MLKYLIPILFLFTSPIANAEKYDRDYRNNALGGIISQTEKRMEQMANDERMRRAINGAVLEGERKPAGTAKITVKKNYPIVPYDPNHPNVQKQSSITIKANAKILAGRFARGLNYAALGAAVIDIVGESVDWVLDPANNRVVFKEPLDGYIFTGHSSKVKSTDISVPTEAECAIHGNGVNPQKPMRGDPETSTTVYTGCNNGWALIWVEKTKDSDLSFDEIADHVITNDTKRDDYNDATNDTIEEQISKGQHDPDIRDAIRQISEDEPDSDPSPDPDNNDQTGAPTGDKTGGSISNQDGTKDGSSDQTKDETKDETKDDGKGETKDDGKGDGKGEAKTKDETKSNSGGGGTNTTELKFPEFCEWASWFCDGDEPKKQDGEVDIEESDIPKNSVNINFGGSCPAPQTFGFSIAGRPMAFVLSYDPICRIAIAFGGIVKVLSTIVAVYILSGAK